MNKEEFELCEKYGVEIEKTLERMVISKRIGVRHTFDRMSQPDVHDMMEVIANKLEKQVVKMKKKLGNQTPPESLLHKIDCLEKNEVGNSIVAVYRDDTWLLMDGEQLFEIARHEDDGWEVNPEMGPEMCERAEMVLTDDR